MVDKAFDSVQTEDLLSIGLTWHRPLPTAMGPSITITDDLGELNTIQLIRRDLAGAR